MTLAIEKPAICENMYHSTAIEISSVTCKGLADGLFQAVQRI